MLGIKKIETVPVANVGDYSFLPPGSKFDFSSFFSGEMKNVPFTQEKCECSEIWKEDSNGKHSNFSISSSTRKKIRETEEFFNHLVSSRNIYKITFVDGSEAVVGSKEFLPKFSFTTVNSGITNKELKYTITLISLHGLLWNRV